MPCPQCQTAARAAAPFQFDVRRLTGVDLIVGGATLVTMISIFLTWFSAAFIVKPAAPSTASILDSSGMSSLASIADDLGLNLNTPAFHTSVSWGAGAFIGLLAALVAAAAAVPAIQSKMATIRR